MTKTQKQVLVSLVLTGIGLAGLLVGQHFHPESNLLGGWALVFAPVYWLGLVSLILASPRLVFDWLTRRRTDGHAESDDAP